MVILLGITTAVCAWGWLTCHVSRMAILYYYIGIKHQREPNDDEIRECMVEAWKHLF